MGAMAMPMPMEPKGAVDLVLLLAMWWVMMAGMMLPGAAPMILTFATINRRRRARGQPYAPTALFAAGYLLAWGGFSVLATLAQGGLERLALLSPMDMTTTSARLGGLLFLAAGLYQLTPLKQACLLVCRSPFEPLAGRRGRRPAHGPQPRPLLPRLLLDPDGAAVRRRRHEPAVGRRSGRRGAG
jgi:predicted metal-binding membrane protein